MTGREALRQLQDTLAEVNPDDVLFPLCKSVLTIVEIGLDRHELRIGTTLHGESNASIIGSGERHSV